MVDQGHNGWAFSWGVLIVGTTHPTLSDNKLKVRSELCRQQHKQERSLTEPSLHGKLENLFTVKLYTHLKVVILTVLVTEDAVFYHQCAPILLLCVYLSSETTGT